jgi:aminoglycoside phosphotransferase (APT) family kinase protein
VTARLHANELPTNAALVRRLLASQLPHWASLPIERVPSSGTDNALYQLGDDMVVRLPRVEWAVSGLVRELEWLPTLTPLLPIEIPKPLAAGSPAAGFPWPWAVYEWLDGANPTLDRRAEPDLLARDLACLIQAFRRIEIDGPSSRRGLPLTVQDEAARTALGELDSEIDVVAAAAAWEHALRAPEWSGPPMWIHGDLLPGNLLVRDGRLTGVLDFALVGVGDPACDLVVAWSVLPGSSRSRFRDELGVDEATWSRGRGWALSIGLVALPYYKQTNPGFAALARHLIREVLAED